LALNSVYVRRETCSSTHVSGQDFCRAPLSVSGIVLSAIVNPPRLRGRIDPAIREV
jgi:hypothetical protein